MNRDEILNEYYYFKTLFKRNWLNEEYHISYAFNDCIYDILYHCDISNEYNYTGWNFINSNKICKKINDESIKYPIYIRVINSITNSNLFSITNRLQYDELIQTNVLLNKIYITLNSNKFLFVSEEDKRYQLVAGLAHEFRHCLEMYVLDDKNVIENDKPQISYISDNLLKIISEEQLVRINHVLYLFSKSEERARIQGTIYYLREMKKDDEERFKTLTIYHKANLSESQHFLMEMETLLMFYDEDIENQQYKRLFQLAYFYKENSGEKTKIQVSEEDIKNYDNLDKHYIRQQAILMKNILQMNLEKFKQELYDAIAYHI